MPHTEERCSPFLSCRYDAGDGEGSKSWNQIHRAGSEAIESCPNPDTNSRGMPDPGLPQALGHPRAWGTPTGVRFQYPRANKEHPTEQTGELVASPCSNAIMLPPSLPLNIVHLRRIVRSKRALYVAHNIEFLRLSRCVGHLNTVEERCGVCVEVAGGAVGCIGELAVAAQCRPYA